MVRYKSPSSASDFSITEIRDLTSACCAAKERELECRPWRVLFRALRVWVRPLVLVGVRAARLLLDNDFLYFGLLLLLVLLSSP
jgi:hypothetical protein